MCDSVLLDDHRWAHGGFERLGYKLDIGAEKIYEACMLVGFGIAVRKQCTCTCHLKNESSIECSRMKTTSYSVAV